MQKQKSNWNIECEKKKYDTESKIEFAYFKDK